MKLMKLTRGCLVAMACFGMLTAQMAQAAAATPQEAPRCTDVALQSGGTLTGQVMDEQGQPQAGAQLVVASEGKIVATSMTDEQGRFEVKGLRGGVYQVGTNTGAVGVYRAWAENTAPPAASQAALLVGNEPVVRGQFGIFSNPWVLAIVVAAAIAIPLGLNDSSSSS